MIEDVKELLQNGKTKSALKKLAQSSDEATILLNRFVSAETQHQLSLMDFDEFSMIQAKIVHAALHILQLRAEDELKATSKEDPAKQGPEKIEGKEDEETFTSPDSTKSIRENILVIHSPGDKDIEMRLNGKIKAAGGSKKSYNWDTLQIDGQLSEKQLKKINSVKDFCIVLVSKELLTTISKNGPSLEDTLRILDNQKKVIGIMVDRVDWTLWPLDGDFHLPSGSLPIEAYADTDGILRKVAASLIERIK